MGMGNGGEVSRGGGEKKAAEMLVASGKSLEEIEQFLAN